LHSDIKSEESEALPPKQHLCVRCAMYISVIELRLMRTIIIKISKTRSSSITTLYKILLTAHISNGLNNYSTMAKKVRATSIVSRFILTTWSLISSGRHDKLSLPAGVPDRLRKHPANNLSGIRSELLPTVVASVQCDEHNGMVQ
jgi:hypothetical protein